MGFKLYKIKAAEQQDNGNAVLTNWLFNEYVIIEGNHPLIFGVLFGCRCTLHLPIVIVLVNGKDKVPWFIWKIITYTVINLTFMGHMFIDFNLFLNAVVGTFIDPYKVR